jgi:S-adenosylmethionine synthetase
MKKAEVMTTLAPRPMSIVRFFCRGTKLTNILSHNSDKNETGEGRAKPYAAGNKHNEEDYVLQVRRAMPILENDLTVLHRLDQISTLKTYIYRSLCPLSKIRFL